MGIMWPDPSIRRSVAPPIPSRSSWASSTLRRDDEGRAADGGETVEVALPHLPGMSPEHRAADPLTHRPNPLDHGLIAGPVGMEGAEYAGPAETREALRVRQPHGGRLPPDLLGGIGTGRGRHQDEGLHLVRREAGDLTGDVPAHREADEGEPLGRVGEDLPRHLADGGRTARVPVRDRPEALEGWQDIIPQRGVGHEAGDQDEVHRATVPADRKPGYLRVRPAMPSRFDGPKLSG